MRFIKQSFCVTRLLAAWAAFFLLTTATAHANDAETTVIVPPGATEVDLTQILDAYKSVESTFGPFRGTFVSTGASERYEPDSRFWESRSDFMLVHMKHVHPLVDVTLRIRFVAGDAGFEGAQASVLAPPLLPTGWRPWVIDDPAGRMQITTPGLLSPQEYDITVGTEFEATSFTVPLGDIASGQGHTTSTTTVDVEVRDIPNRPIPLPGDEIPTVLFYRIDEGSSLIAAIRAEFIVDDETNIGDWYVHITNLEPGFTPVRFPLDRTRNQLILRRWTDREDNSGTELYVNDHRVANIDSAPHSAVDAVHTLTPVDEESASGLRLIVENPKARRSDTLISTDTEIIEDRFTGGPSSEWQVSNAPTQQFPAQDLPGPGQQLDIDFGQISTGQSSYAWKDLALPAGGVEGADGYGVRFWIDPTNVTLQAGEYLGIFAGCPETGTCSAFRVWLLRTADDTGFALHLTAQQSDGSFVGVYSPITTGPQQVEVRMRNSWLAEWAPNVPMDNGSIEMWIDGTLINRVENVNNFDKQLDLIRFGALGTPAGTAGILSLDEFAFWRFD